MLLRAAIDESPRDDADETQRSGHEKRRRPTQVQRDPRHGQRRDDRADIAAGVEHTGCQCPLFAWKPFADGLDCRGKVSALRQPQSDARRTKTGDAAGESMRHRRQAPEQDRQRIADAQTDRIHQPSAEEISRGVGEIEPEDGVAVVDLVPAQVALERRLEHADHAAIDVVDGGGEEEQPADPPAHAAIGAGLRLGIAGVIQCLACGGHADAASILRFLSHRR